MRISRAVLAATVLTGATAVALAATAGPAAADTLADLPITSFGDIAVDGSHQRIFLSDPYAGAIVATNYRGKEVGRVSGLPGVRALALSADSSTIYATLEGEHEIVAIATGPVTESARYPVGAGRWATHVVPVGDKLWFSFDDYEFSGGFGNFGVLDPATGAITEHDYAADEVWFASAPALVTNPANPGLLAVTAVNNSGGDTAVFDVSSGTPVLKVDTSTGYDIRDAALTADGTDLYTAGYGVDRTAVPGGTPVAVLPDDSFHSAVDVAADGRIAVGRSWSDTQPDVFILPAGGTAKTFELNSWELAPRGLAWEPGGSLLFAVAGSHQFRLHTLNDPSTEVPPTPEPKQEVFLNFGGVPLTAARGETLSFRGYFGATGNIPIPEGSEVTVTRFDLETPKGTPLGTRTTDAQGSFAVTDTPPVGGDVTYQFAYAGDARFQAKTGSWTIEVARERTDLDLPYELGYDVHAYGTTVNVVATLGATHRNRVVEIWADPYGTDQPARLLKKATADRDGDVSVKLRLTRTTVVTAKFAGDGWTAPATVTARARTRVAASTTLSRHYRTAKIGKTTYRFFRKSKNPLVTQTMTAHPGRKVRTIYQVWSGGSWQLWSGRYTKLSTSGKASFSFVTGTRVGRKFRVRAEYLPGNSGDSVNQVTYGAWKYFTYTK